MQVWGSGNLLTAGRRVEPRARTAGGVPRQSERSRAPARARCGGGGWRGAGASGAGVEEPHCSNVGSGSWPAAVGCGLLWGNTEEVTALHTGCREEAVMGP